MRYRHKPTEVEAEHYTLGNLPAVKAFLDEVWPGGYQFSDDGSHLLIETREGDRDCSADDGYWIVEDLRGIPYPVSAEIFADSYEEAQQATDWRAIREWLIKARGTAKRCANELRPGDPMWTGLEAQVEVLSSALDFMDERERA